MFALVQLSGGQVIGIYDGVPNVITLPNGEQVLGAASGWTNGAYSLLPVTAGSIAAGQQQNGAATYSYAGGVVAQTIPTVAIPNSTLAAQQYNAAINAGVTLTWSSSTTLNGTYALDTNTQVGLVGEYLSTQNFTKTVNWYLMNGTAVTMTPTQADIFGAAIWSYLTQLRAAQASMAAGDNPTWPNAAVAVTG